MDAKKGKTRKESTPIKVWVTPEEKSAIAAKADAHSLSASSYLRRLGLAMPLQSTIDQRAILDLVKINADLGRFGGESGRFSGGIRLRTVGLRLDKLFACLNLRYRPLRFINFA